MLFILFGQIASRSLNCKWAAVAVVFIPPSTTILYDETYVDEQQSLTDNDRAYVQSWQGSLSQSTTRY